MKAVEEVTCCVVDYGNFVSLADKLGETMKKVYYSPPNEREFQDIRDMIQGEGLDHVERISDFWDIIGEIDLFVFPDIGHGGLQRHLRGMGKAVWGSMGADELELYRTQFLEVLEDVGLPIVSSQEIVGLSDLRSYLKDKTNKWIKVNRFRANLETWHHFDNEHSQRTFDNLAVIFGGAQDLVTFVVQDDLKSDMEIGYDGWCIDGKFPNQSFQGYEKKNELYLGSLLRNIDLPHEILTINSAMAPVLQKYGYRNWWATEIRVVKDVPYFIDPTARMPGQTGEHQLETCENLANILWYGANGVVVEPAFNWEFAAEATLHYDAESQNLAIAQEWKTLRIPESVAQWVKLGHYCKIDELYHMVPSKTGECGVVLGVGDSVQESIDHLKDNLKALDKLPVHANTAGFADLLKSIKEAEAKGMMFGGEIPEPESILK